MLIPLKVIGVGMLYSLGINYWSDNKVNMLKIASTENDDYKPYFSSNILKKTISDDSKIVEKFDDIKKWNYLFNKNEDNLIICNGNYEYLHRSNIDNEEKWMLCTSRNSLHNILFRREKKDITKIIIDKEKNSKLRERFILFGIIPVVIKWYGKVNNNTIKWESSELLLPCVKFIKPKISEKLRKNDWKLKYIYDDIHIFHIGEDKDNKKLAFELKKNII